MKDDRTAIEVLRAFVTRPIALQCRPAGRKDATEQFTAHVGHFLNSPAGPAEIAELRKRLGSSAAQVAAFYSRHNGFVLYRDTLSNAAGVEAYPIRLWGKATEQLHDAIREENDGDDEEEQTSALISCVVIGTVPRSGNYFAVQTVGPNQGAIYLRDHETLLAEQEPFAADFDAFVSRLISDPIELLVKTLGCFTRYSDGETRTQWFPVAVEQSG